MKKDFMEPHTQYRGEVMDYFGANLSRDGHVNLSRIQWINIYIAAVHHWNEIIEFLESSDFIWHEDRCRISGGSDKSIGYSSRACVYCRIFINDCTDINDCIACPLVAFGFGLYCNGTPWHSFSTAAHDGNRDEALIQAVRMRDCLLGCKPNQISDYKIP